MHGELLVLAGAGVGLLAGTVTALTHLPRRLRHRLGDYFRRLDE